MGARGARLAVRGRILGVLAVAAAAALALLSAPAAQATNGGAHGYLPEKDDWCLGEGEPTLTDVGTQHAFVRFDYFDDCLFPAKVLGRDPQRRWRLA
jgi:hypothetical protein